MSRTGKRILIRLETPSTPFKHHLNRLYLYCVFKKFQFSGEGIEYRVKFDPQPPGIHFYSHYYSDVLTWFKNEGGVYNPNVLFLLWHVDPMKFESTLDLRVELRKILLPNREKEDPSMETSSTELESDAKSLLGLLSDERWNQASKDDSPSTDQQSHNRSESSDESLDESLKTGVDLFVKVLSHRSSEDGCITSICKVLANEEAENLPLSSSLEMWKEAIAECKEVKNNLHCKIASGGTFDHMHVGHFLLLTYQSMLYSEGDNSSFIVGISSDELLVNKKNKTLIESFETRMEKVRSIVEELRPNMTTNLVSIRDPWGPTIVDSTIEALVVSEETIIGGKIINEMRAEKGMLPLKNYIIPCIQAQGEKDKVSSTRIRENLMHRPELL